MLHFKGLKAVVLLFLTLSPAMAGAEAVDWIAARVNGDIILYSELKERIKAVEQVSPQMAGSMQKDRLEREVLEQIIRERLTDQQIKNLKITVNKGDIDRVIEDIKRENGVNDMQFEYALSQQGTSLAQLREKIKQEMERSRLIERAFKSKTMISEDMITAYLRKTGGSSGAVSGPRAVSGLEQRRRLALIFLPVAESAGKDARAKVEDQAEKIRERAASGADFAALAREFSKGPEAQNGGDIGNVAVSELAAPMEEATRGLPPGSISKVVSTPGGYFILKVLEVQKESPTPSVSAGVDVADPKAREKARRTLMQEEVNRKYDEWIRDLQSRSFIEINLKPGEAAQ